MTVSESITLPAQPATGAAHWIPLGGDGYTFPLGAYSLKGWKIDGDASAGSAFLKCFLDDRYSHLVHYVCGQIKQGTAADADLFIECSGEEVMASRWAGLVAAGSKTTNVTTIAKTIYPPSVLLPGAGAPFTLCQFVNVGVVDDYLCDAYIFEFQLDAIRRTPMTLIAACRGGMGGSQA